MSPRSRRRRDLRLEAQEIRKLGNQCSMKLWFLKILCFHGLRKFSKTRLTEHDKLCPPKSPLSVESDAESDFELTPIENYAMKMIKAEQIQLGKQRKLTSHYKRTKTISWPKQDLFLSSQEKVYISREKYIYSSKNTRS